MDFRLNSLVKGVAVLGPLGALITATVGALNYLLQRRTARRADTAWGRPGEHCWPEAANILGGRGLAVEISYIHDEYRQGYQARVTLITPKGAGLRREGENFRKSIDRYDFRQLRRVWYGLERRSCPYVEIDLKRSNRPRHVKASLTRGDKELRGLVAIIAKSNLDSALIELEIFGQGDGRRLMKSRFSVSRAGQPIGLLSSEPLLGKVPD